MPPLLDPMGSQQTANLHQEGRHARHREYR